MKFKKGTRQKPLEYEREIVSYWKENKTFEKSVAKNPSTQSYVFYDGPPFITGIPHHGTLLSSIVKDAVPRYQTMKGKRVERVWGWDCHGLPAEVFTEKKLGITDKRDIGTKITLEEYINTCRTNMVTTGDLWETTIDRIGRWVEFKGAYKTMDKEYMESVWWAFKELYGKGKIYEGEKVLLYCTRDATPISKAEVAMDNSYQDVTDPSVFVKFKLTNTSLEKLKEHSGLSSQIDEVQLLAWTTTPWTLNANTAIAINKEILYSLVEVDGQKLVIAKNLVEKVLKDEKHQPLKYEVLKELNGSLLEGLEYQPLFADRGKNAHKIWHADFVTDADGTGIAHEAPAYGEDDYAMAKANKIPMVLDTDDEGFYSEGPFKGRQIWESNKEIAKELLAQGVVWKIEYIRHEYPHCHRCGTKLQYRAHPSWFMDIDGQRTEMLEGNGEINWFPEHIKHGRFEKTVQSAPDWNISRDRFWATAMPVWKGVDKDGKEHCKVIGSYEELKKLSGVELEDYHRPWVDDITFEIDGVTYKRIEKVLDCWFESGSMPFAQFHYPFENVKKFEENFPGDFIVEYVGQVRAWFYYMHAVSMGLFGRPSYKNVIVTGSIMGSDGKKLSKSLGNFTDPNIVMDTYSADALRYVLLSSPLLNGEDFTLKDKEIGDTQRKLAMVWNMYDFFTLYAEVDGWEYKPSDVNLLDTSTNVLDTWIISRMHQLISEVETHMEVYDIPNAIKPILPFIDDASNWFVRRSRKRFWKSDNDGDKNDAYATLHYVLVQLSKVMAPFTPFMSEALYKNLTGEESVHLTDWPTENQVDELVIERMAHTRKIIEQGLALRMLKSDTEEQVKVRQPLALLTYGGNKLDLQYEEMITEEVNVKAVAFTNTTDDVVLDKTITDELLAEGNAREIVRLVQSARKKADLNVDDRILLQLKSTDKNISKALAEHADYIAKETLATVSEVKDPAYQEESAIGTATLDISLSKA